VAIRDVEKSKELVKLVAKHYPHLEVVANAADRSAAYKLMDLGVERIRRETFGSALSLGQDSLKLLGFDPYEAHRMTRLFRKRDEASMPELHRIYREDVETYISTYRKHSEEIEELIKLDRSSTTESVDKAWTAGNPEK